MKVPPPADLHGPLVGLRVLEVGSFIAGPFAGQLLADYGAEVVKVESVRGGDPMRRWGITQDGQSLWWPAIARNKRSIALDLRAAMCRDIVRRLITECDVVLENFRPGRMAEWGLDYAELSELNPRIVLVHVSGFGQTGPRSNDAGFGSIGEAIGGIRFTTGEPSARPSRTGVSLGDSLAALFAVIGTLAALAERDRSGRGQEVDVAIYEAVAALMESTMVDFERAGVLRTRTGSVLKGVAPSNVYSCSDGTEILIAANADSVFGRLCRVMGQPELAADARFVDHASRGSNAEILDALIDEWTSTLAASQLLGLLTENGVPSCTVYSAPDMLVDPHYAARNMVLRPISDGVVFGPMPGIVPKFSRTPGAVTSVGPSLGEHTRSVLTHLGGVDETQWQALEQAELVLDGATSHAVSSIDDPPAVSTAMIGSAPGQSDGSGTYEAIRDLILDGTFEVGKHLVEADLATQLEISRTPVREALRRLASEGLITFQRNRGAWVAGWSAVELAEIFELRALLESYGARLAAARVTEDDLVSLRVLAQRMEDLVAVDEGHQDFHQIALANNDFHLGILRAAGNEHLVNILSSLLHVPLVQRTFADYSPAALQRSLAHHRECIAALEKNDGMWAESVVRAHILAARPTRPSDLPVERSAL
jgi:formyl-CoA transferase